MSKPQPLCQDCFEEPCECLVIHTTVKRVRPARAKRVHRPEDESARARKENA